MSPLALDHPGMRGPRRRRPVGAGRVAAATLGVLLAIGWPVLCAHAPRALAAGAPRCSTAQLVLWVNAEGAGAAGSFYYHLEMTNLSSRPCSLSGYPGVSAVDLDGGRIGRPAGRERFGSVATVVLAPGAGTTAMLHVTDVGALPGGCRPVLAAGLRVYPPGERTSKFVPFPFRTCSSEAYGAMLVRSVRSERA